MNLLRFTSLTSWALGCVAFAGALAAQPAEAPPRTEITANALEMQGTEDRNFFYFRGDVEVTGTNLRILCDELTVTSFRAGATDAAVGELGAVEEIIAAGNVEIHQAGRSAYAGRAMVDPVAGTVTLAESPRIVDGEVEIEGYQFVLYQNDRKFLSVPDPNAPAKQPSRSVVRLGAMPDLGFDQTSADAVTVNDAVEGVTPVDESAGELVDPDAEAEAEEAPESSL